MLALCSCSHIYHAPSNAKLEASTKRLSNAVVKATNTAERAKAHVDAAKKAADKEATSSATVLTQLNDLLKVLPPELKGKGDALKTAVEKDQGDIGEIVTQVDGAENEHTQLTKDLDEAKAADAQVKVDKQQYYQGADKLAAVATKQSGALAWYRLHWWLGTFVAIGGIVLCIVLAILKWGAKWTAKLGIAAAKTGI
jgi:chromosome segregation ATPase